MILIGADIAGAYVLSYELAVSSTGAHVQLAHPVAHRFADGTRVHPAQPVDSGIAAPISSPTGVVSRKARVVMQRYGAVVLRRSSARARGGSGKVRSKWQQLLSGEFLGLTLVIGCLALGSGLVLFGFNLWIPSNLRKLGYTEADAILRNASAMGFPLTFPRGVDVRLLEQQEDDHAHHVAHGGGAVRLRARRGCHRCRDRSLLYLLLIVPIWGISAVVAVLSVYSAEIYPTRVRSRGAGFAAGASKAGGVAIIGLVAFGITTPSIAKVALIGAIPMTIAVILVAIFGVETRQRRLEDITAEQLKVSGRAVSGAT